MSYKEHATGPGESLCWIALEHDLDDCRRLLPENPDLAPGELPGGTLVLVPDQQAKDEDVQSEALHPFLLGLDRVRIEFIRDNGEGYRNSDNVIDDPVVRDHLSITNYVVDRSGDGTQPGRWPGPDFFGFDADASADPDHFKVQVFDPGVPAVVESIEVELFALKPGYRRLKTVAQRAREGFTRPADARRTLRVQCQRVGMSSFFRSAYLRLVAFESDRARRPKQCLLVSDYFADGATEFERFHTEILHQRIEAHYQIPTCPFGKCGISRILPLPATRGIPLGFHVIGDPTSAADQAVLDELRANVYTWARRIFAAAGLMTPIVQARIVEPPRNVILIGSAHNAGTQATGLGNFRVEFEVDGTALSVPVRGGATAAIIARDVAAAITANADPAIQRALSGYRATTHVVNANPTRFATAFNCHDVLVFRPDGAQAAVTNVSTNNPDLEVTGVDPAEFAPGGFFLSADDPREGTPQERAIFWNYAEERMFNCFVVPAAKIRLQSDLRNLGGISRPGVFGPSEVSLGPCVYLTRDFPKLPQLLTHEIAHVLIHCEHADAPLRDNPPPAAQRARQPSVTELLGARQSPNDTHDMDRHISDGPIAAIYDVYEPNGGIAHGQRLDGNPATGGRMCPFDSAQPDTPVARLWHFARRYGLLRNTVSNVPLDPALRKAPTAIADRAPEPAGT